MNLNDLLEKLEPLLGQKVSDWRRTLEFADVKLKTILEQHIRWVARRKLGDNYERRILLSLPPKNVIDGPVGLGTVVYDTPRWPCGLSHTELTQHLAILGRSGAGKTNVAYHLMQQLSEQRVPWLFLDWKRSARDLIPCLKHRVQVFTPGRDLGPFPFNPFLLPPGIEKAPYVNLVVDQFAEAFVLGEGAKNILQRALAACYRVSDTPTVRDVLTEIENTKTKSRSTGWKMSALRALESYDLAVPEHATKDSQAKFAEQLLTGQTILELDALSHSTKKFLIPLLCQWLYSVQLGSGAREKLQFVVFVEEAHHVLYRGEYRSRETLMNRMLRQCRELGIGYVILNQQPHTLSAAALGNCFATICLNQKHPSDVNAAVDLSGLPVSEKHIFGSLAVGQGVVKMQARWHRAFLVEFPDTPIKKGLVSDALLKQYVSGKLKQFKVVPRRNTSRNTCEIPATSAAECGTRPQINGQGGTRAGSGTVAGRRVPRTDTTMLTLLHDCVQFPADGVRQRYKRLGVGASTGNRLKSELIDAGLVVPKTVKHGRAIRTLLELTPQAEQLLMPLGRDRDGRASFQHEYWKQRLAEDFESQGYEAAMEVPRGTGGRADLVAIRNGLTAVIEVETGKSEVVENVKKNLREGFTDILVVVTDEDAVRRVKKHLDKAGLLIAPRVQVIIGHSHPDK